MERSLIEGSFEKFYVHFWNSLVENGPEFRNSSETRMSWGTVYELNSRGAYYLWRRSEFTKRDEVISQK